jgi:hypothetical protein
VHRRLGMSVREALVRAADGDQTGQRGVDAVDAVLTRHAAALGVPEFRRVTDRLVEHLNPPSPDGAHERRYLHLSVLADGSLLGNFACGPEQALALTAAIAAGAAPHPGLAVDADGVERPVPDQRTASQRRMDALVQAVTAGVVTAGVVTAGADAVAGDGAGADAVASPEDAGTDRLGARSREVRATPCRVEDGPADDPRERAPEPEGEHEIRRAPGERAGPYPDVEIVVVAGLDHLAAAVTLDQPPPAASPADAQGFARDHLGTPVHPRTLALLSCSARLRKVALDRNGAVLDLGRAQRLASPAHKRVLLARDGGCVLPGCAVPGQFCDVHHVIAWADGGPTDIANLALVCPRHHAETHQGVWQLEMIAGIPWARVPSWVDPARPLLRNCSHRPLRGTAA